MKYTKFITIITLSGFSLLIVCFVAFKIGAFDRFFITDKVELPPYPNDSTIVNKHIDTAYLKTNETKTEPLPDSQFLIMSSSKSMIMTERKLNYKWFFNIDSLTKDSSE